MVAPSKRIPVTDRLPPYPILDSSKLREVVSDFEEITNPEHHCVELERRLHKLNYPELTSNSFDWNGFPRNFRAAVLDNFTTHTTTVESAQTSADASTTKLLIKLYDSHMVESVIMRHETGRITLCVSSQVGCQMGCTFCATGTMGIIGDLSTGEVRLERSDNQINTPPTHTTHGAGAKR